jgi:UDP-N-acetylmuramoyl-tripeptide--D-alanyl-D-alanine ligase
MQDNFLGSISMEISSLYQKFLQSGSVSTDSRNITPGSVFFALKGEKFNANEFADEALAKGASHVVVSEPNYVKDDRFTLVKDTLLALQALARHHRQQLSIPVIGLTGSNGKTTSKELLHAVLSQKYRTLSTKGNLNNHIGVPLTILSIDSSIEIAVIEMGANHVGEIALLSTIANPTHGFITNIGKAHIGTFGGFDNIIRGKSELYQHLINHDGVVFINSQNPILFNMAKRFSKPILYPAKHDYYHCEFLGVNPFVEVKAEDGSVIKTNLIGKYNFENIATALCIGKYFEVEASLANRAIANYLPTNMRSQVVKKGSNTIILDAYNANPSSMMAAVENMQAMELQPKVLILGDMYELEETSEAEHAALGKAIMEMGFTRVYFCGKLMEAAYRAFPKAQYFLNKSDLESHLKSNPISDSAILIKASRGVALETVVEYL